HHAADGRRFGHRAIAPGIEQDLFIGADDAGRAIELIYHHAAATDGVEFALSHPSVSGLLEFPWRGHPRSHPITLPFGLQGGAGAAADLIEAPNELAPLVRVERRT